MHKLQYVIVLKTSNKNRVLEGSLASRIKELLFECAQINSWNLPFDQVIVDPGHVRMTIQLEPEVTVHKVINTLKSYSNKRIRGEFPDLKEHIFGTKFWDIGYCTETIGGPDWESRRKQIVAALTHAAEQETGYRQDA